MCAGTDLDRPIIVSDVRGFVSNGEPEEVVDRLHLLTLSCSFLCIRSSISELYLTQSAQWIVNDISMDALKSFSPLVADHRDVCRDVTA